MQKDNNPESNPKCPKCQNTMEAVMHKTEPGVDPLKRPNWKCDKCGETLNVR